MARCQQCGDTGILTKPGSDTLVECQCALVRRLAASMPPHIRRANTVREHFDLPLVRKPFRSAFVRSSWADMKAMVKAVIMTNPSSYIKVTSDREILDVYLGKKARGVRDFETRKVRTAADLEDSDASYNSIEDLMDAPKLCVVRLNEIGYKNKSAAGVLLEAVEYRVDRDKPVWVVQDTMKPFTQGSPAWSETVWEYLTTTIPSADIPRLAPAVALELTDNDFAYRSSAEPSRAGDSAQRRLSDAQAAPAPARPVPPAPDPVEHPERLRPHQPMQQPQPAPRRRRVEESEERPAGLEMYGTGLGNGGKGRFKKGD